MEQKKAILCIGSVLWDIIGRADVSMVAGNDMPGRITRIPGGVAMNIAIALSRLGLSPIVISSVGKDSEGEELITQARALGVNCEYLYRSNELATDRYMAVEAPNGLIAAIADAHSLEAVGSRILTPLQDGRLGSADAPYQGVVALDGNLTVKLLDEISTSDLFTQSDLRIAPASPGKADRLLPFLRAKRGTLYVNLEEAGLLCHTQFTNTLDAGAALLERGAARALITNGGEPCCDATAEGLVQAQPPKIQVARVTGAGDTFMAAHIAAELRGSSRTDALDSALAVAAAHVSGETAL